MVAMKNGVSDSINDWIRDFAKANPDATGNSLVDQYATEHKIKDDKPLLWKETLKPRLLTLIEHGYVNKDWLNRRYRRFGEVTEDSPRRGRPRKAEAQPATAEPDNSSLTLDEVVAWLSQDDMRVIEAANKLGAKKFVQLAESAVALAEIDAKYEAERAAIMGRAAAHK